MSYLVCALMVVHSKELMLMQLTHLTLMAVHSKELMVVQVTHSMLWIVVCLQ